MSVESVQVVVEKTVGLWWLLCPLWICSAIICFSGRRKPNVTPLWAFMATSVVCLYATVVVMSVKTSQLGGHPDNGWVRMGTGYLQIFVLPELASGVLLLAAVPWRSAWNFRVVLPCIGASLLSITACAAAAYFVPNPRTPPRNVEIVVPDGYRGLIVIQVDKVRGVPPERTWRGITRYIIPASGELLTTEEGPLISWHKDYGRYASGAELPMLDTSRPDGEGFLTMESWQGEHLMWVGTKGAHDHFKKTHNPPWTKPKKPVRELK